MSQPDDFDHDIPSPVEFAPPPDDSSDTSSISIRSMSKVERVLAARGVSPPPKEKRRPPALQRRSSSIDSYKRFRPNIVPVHGRNDSLSGVSALGISVSSTIYPNSAIGRTSFIDLDDATPLSDSQSGRSPRGGGADVRSIDSSAPSEFYARGLQGSNPNAMYPTPTRASFRPHSRIGTPYSDTSQLPTFASPDAAAAPYQPSAPVQRRRSRPRSMLSSPSPIANDFFDYTTELPTARSKPPLPKGPKPAQLLRKTTASSNPSSPKDSLPSPPPLPPTTNNRDPSERQELLRKHRKLAQMFGEGVGGMLWPNDDIHTGRTRVRGPVPPSSHRKGSLSADANEDGRGQVVIMAPVRRHSTPTSAEFGDYSKMVQTARNDVHTSKGGGSDSPKSFMELSEDDESDTRRGLESSTHDQFPEGTAEQERKKMRDKLAKLHRFLGSRVPVELALGAEYALKDQDLPKPAPVAPSPASDKEGDMKDGGKKWKRRRRSSSSAALPGYVVIHPPAEPLDRHARSLPSDERMKDELGEKERAINVKRANKMEQMFGARPPPRLYQTRPAHAPAPRLPRLKSQVSEPFLLPTVRYDDASLGNKGKRRPKRPGTSESSQALLGEDRATEGISNVYMYYRHSLNSLTDIIDKDDKESLAELHQYINGPSSSDDEAPPGPEAGTSASAPSRFSLERRRSLPARTSMVSISSSINLPPPSPNPSGFQQRRRRAAKLTNFFGVNYRDLFGDVLDSIEMGMREEEVAGSLKGHELEELLGKLRGLKIRRDEITV